MLKSNINVEHDGDSTYSWSDLSENWYVRRYLWMNVHLTALNTDNQC
jgi:hypothetical protein